MLTLKATVDGEPVEIAINDLTEFVHAEMDAQVCVIEANGQQTFVEKCELNDIEVLTND